jgi:hypothetical protein
MTKYSTSTDLPAYLEMSRAGNVVVDRVTRPSVVVRHAAVSITGTIQPRVWDAAMEEEVRAAGLPARILVARPPRRRKRWTDATVTIPTADAWDNVVTRALDLPYDPEAGPTCVTLSPAASAAFIEWFEDGSAAAENADDDTCAALSKLEGYGARIALVFHVMGALADRVPVPAEIPGPTMENAIRLCTWFRGEAERLYGAGEAASRAKAAKIIDEWGQARITAGDNVTLSIVTRRGPRAYRGSDGRAKAVRDLRAAKWAPEPTPEPKGRGRPPAAAWWPGGKRPARLAPLDPGADGALNGQARKDGEYPRHALQDPSAPSNADELVTAANRALAGTHGANEWPRSDGTCPACGHHECFNVHPENPSRWCCHSDSHGADSGGCGREAKGVWSGDALDLEVRARGRTNRDRIAVARDVLGLDQREVSA